ncbi:probable E3 ubiquitin-protein ligase DTX3 [Haliotis rufescens]|uniref:probable E3 ubiquitin-protein ligase DTX3 n=1 Tax=Haliotis rufescens TaxID=6454 RepID=UPI00201F5230|nr:probable E3 ubiquitin-protein ligase DTX3 [Haliotis rufescens]
MGARHEKPLARPASGTQPDGSMNVALSQTSLPGHDLHGTIIIIYKFPDGTQGRDHPSPGDQYKGTTRVAYLPDCREGRGVLQLLRTAFDRKLTFTIGRSTTTSEENVVTWNGVSHKTLAVAGTSRWSYPDPTYLVQVREELARKGVTENGTTGSSNLFPGDNRVHPDGKDDNKKAMTCNEYYGDRAECSRQCCIFQQERGRPGGRDRGGRQALTTQACCSYGHHKRPPGQAVRDHLPEAGHHDVAMVA